MKKLVRSGIDFERIMDNCASLYDTSNWGDCWSSYFEEVRNDFCCGRITEKEAYIECESVCENLDYNFNNVEED